MASLPKQQEKVPTETSGAVCRNRTCFNGGFTHIYPFKSEKLTNKLRPQVFRYKCRVYSGCRTREFDVQRLLNFSKMSMCTYVLHLKLYSMYT